MLAAAPCTPTLYPLPCTRGTRPINPCRLHSSCTLQTPLRSPPDLTPTRGTRTRTARTRGTHHHPVTRLNPPPCIRGPPPNPGARLHNDMTSLCNECTMQALHSAITPPSTTYSPPPLVFSYPPRNPRPRNPRNPTPDAYPHHHTLCSPPDLTPTRGTRTLSSLTRRVNHAPAPTPPASANAHTSSHPTAPGESPRIAAKRPNPIPLSCPPGKPKTHLLLFLLPAPPAAPCPRCPAPAEPALTPPLLPPPPHHPAPEHPSRIAANPTPPVALPT